MAVKFQKYRNRGIYAGTDGVQSYRDLHVGLLSNMLKYRHTVAPPDSAPSASDSRMSIIEETAISAGQAAVTREQQRLRAEITAFQEFADRVSNIELQHPQPQHHRSGGGTLTISSADQVVGDNQSQPFTAIRTAYRETVFAVDHWQTTYTEDTVEESVRSEFSTDLAETLLNPSQTPFSSMLHNRFITEAKQAAAARKETLTVVEAEATQLDTLMNELKSTIELLRSVEHDTESFAIRVQRLEIAHQSLEELAHTQQEYLQNRQTDANSLFTELIYDELEASYPGLSAIAAIRSLLDRLELRLWAGLI